MRICLLIVVLTAFAAFASPEYVDKPWELREGADVTLYIKEGGAHFWPAICQEIIRATDWLEAALRE